jgi:hypothetical protein
VNLEFQLFQEAISRGKEMEKQGKEGRQEEGRKIIAIPRVNCCSLLL